MALTGYVRTQLESALLPKWDSHAQLQPTPPDRKAGPVLPGLLTFQEKLTILTFELNVLLLTCWQRSQIQMPLRRLVGSERSS